MKRSFEARCGIRRSWVLVLCTWLVFSGCDNENESSNSDDVAADASTTPLDAVDQFALDADVLGAEDSVDAGPDVDTIEQVDESTAPDVGPDEEPPTWSQLAYLKASNVGPYQAWLNWGHEQGHGESPATDNVAVTTYAIFQDGVMVGEVDADDAYSFHPEGIQPDTVYVFQVQAGDAAGNWSTDGPTVQVKTECATYWEDKCPVSWPPDAVLTAEPTGDTGVLLTWTPAYDNQEVTSYRVLQDGECLCQDFGVPETNYTVEGDVTEYEVTGLQQGQTYHFQISARDSVGIENGGGGWILGPELEVTP
ncbi:MAG: fibronectin type III domain-containing protein [Pseudomonadota bacterium]